MALELDQVTVMAGRATLIRGVSFAVRPGRFLAVLGANGAGKSTALAALAGDIAPDRGRVLLDGADLRTVRAPALATRRAIVRQHAPISFPFPVLDVVALGRHPHGEEGGQDMMALEDAMGAVGVQHLAQRDYTALSGGERQRVQIARALAQLWSRDSVPPRYLLMDEPTAHLDLKQQIIALEVARRFADNGGGVLCILHDIRLACEFADEAVLMHAGEVLANGAPRAVLTPANLRTAFGVSEVRAAALAS